MTREALTEGKKVVVSNTFVRLREITPYMSMAERLPVVEAKGIWGNVHGVPETTIQKLPERWDVRQEHALAPKLMYL